MPSSGYEPLTCPTNVAVDVFQVTVSPQRTSPQPFCPPHLKMTMTRASMWTWMPWKRRLTVNPFCSRCTTWMWKVRGQRSHSPGWQTLSGTRLVYLPDDLRRLGVVSRGRRPFGPRPSSVPGTDLEREDTVDGQGTRWRCFSTGDPTKESRVNMSVLEPFVRVLSHGGMQVPEWWPLPH